MSIKDELTNAVKESMKSGDNMAKLTLRGVLAAIKQVEIDQRIELKDEDVLGILQKQVKSRNESISDAEKAGRQDLIDEAKAEISLLEKYLPAGLSEEEVKAIVEEAIAEVGASSPADMGNVMKVLMPKVKGKADGSLVSKMVKDLLLG